MDAAWEHCPSQGLRKHQRKVLPEPFGAVISRESQETPLVQFIFPD